jgi:glutamine phosphoribosylpyrophosphate amidotransferase
LESVHGSIIALMKDSIVRGNTSPSACSRRIVCFAS